MVIKALKKIPAMITPIKIDKLVLPLLKD